MNKNNYPLKLAPPVKKAVVEIAAVFFQKRAGKATGAGLMTFPRSVPGVPPDPHDERRRDERRRDERR